jgi:hypothetical protein
MKLRHRLMLAGMAGIMLTGPAMAQQIGPSTTTEPYVLPTHAGVSTISILTTGDSVGGYRMVGIPDGMGIWGRDHRTFNLINTHELGKDAGVVRAHGSTGSFVAKWRIDRHTLEVLSGRDHMTSPNDLLTWNGVSYVPGTSAIDRLCSADLAAQDAYDVSGLSGTLSRILLNRATLGRRPWSRLRACCRRPGQEQELRTAAPRQDIVRKRVSLPAEQDDRDAER